MRGDATIARPTLTPMQVSVLRVETTSRVADAVVVTDSGHRLTVPGSVVAGSRLRHLRPGQRLHVTVSPDGSEVERIGLTVHDVS